MYFSEARGASLKAQELDRKKSPTIFGFFDTRMTAKTLRSGCSSLMVPILTPARSRTNLRATKNC